MVAVWGVVMLDGAVYRPLALIVPAFAVHVTALLLALFTVAESWYVCPPYSVRADGTTLTEIGGDSVEAAEADLVGSSWLVAVTVTIC
jgi:hypothetical protein